MFSDAKITEIKRALRRAHAPWEQRRLQVVDLLCDSEPIADIIKETGVSRQTIYNYRAAVISGGVRKLLKRGKAKGRIPLVKGIINFKGTMGQ